MAEIDLEAIKKEIIDRTVVMLHHSIYSELKDIVRKEAREWLIGEGVVALKQKVRDATLEILETDKWTVGEKELSFKELLRSWLHKIPGVNTSWNNRPVIYDRMMTVAEGAARKIFETEINVVTKKMILKEVSKLMKKQLALATKDEEEDDEV